MHVLSLPNHSLLSSCEILLPPGHGHNVPANPEAVNTSGACVSHVRPRHVLREAHLLITDMSTTLVPDQGPGSTLNTRGPGLLPLQRNTKSLLCARGLILLKKHFVGTLHVSDTLPLWKKTPELQSEPGPPPPRVEVGTQGEGTTGRGVWRTSGLSPASTSATTSPLKFSGPLPCLYDGGNSNRPI